jgi:SAM-dependent methyltransferase
VLEPLTDRPAVRASLARSARLFRAFRKEQSDPDLFYRALAADSVVQLERFAELDKALVLDVGVGPGYFADAFLGAGATYVGIDPDLGELSAAGAPGPGTVLGSGLALPVRSGCVDLTYSSNVLEHVADPELMADEMVRVTRPGGTVFLSWTTWLSPHGGHETAPWHYLGGRFAAERFARRHGRRPKNDFGVSLFAVSAGRMRRWVARGEQAGRFELVAAFPRYHPWWAQWVAVVPGLRELACWNYVMVLRVR